MVPVEKGATNYEQAFYDVSIAYIASAKNMSECNIKAKEGLKLQRSIIERIEKKQEQK